MISVDSGSSSRGPAALDVGQHADRAEQMLVDRVVMVHVELHHGDDAAELGDEAAEHAGFVHAPQRHLGAGCRGQQLDEDAVGFRIVAQLVVDQAQRLAQQPDRVGVQERVGRGSASAKKRMRLTGSRLNTSGSATFRRSLSMRKSVRVRELAPRLPVERAAAAG